MVTLTARRLAAHALFLPAPMPIHFKRVPLAVTVHDIIPLVLRGAYSRRNEDLLLRHSYASSLRSADVVFTDSEHSKADILSHCKMPEARVVVAYPGLDASMFRPGRVDPTDERNILTRYGIDQPYVLHVGHVQPYKNIERLVRAFRQLKQRREDLSLQLVLCGTFSPRSQDLFQALQDPTLRKDVVLTGMVSDQDLAVLYRAAACFAMPSLYEGFGLPVLEAMASGIPVMSSNRTSLPEVGGDAVLYFNPQSEEEISEAMERLLCDSALREQLVKSGCERISQFSWEGCARTTLEALKAL